MEMSPFTPEMKQNAEEIFAQYSKLIYNIAYGILKDSSLAEDCLQETVIGIVMQQAKPDSQGYEKPEAFIRIAAKNRSICLLRKRRREMPYETVLLDEIQRQPCGQCIDSYFIDEYGFSREINDCLKQMKESDAYLIILRVAYLMPYEKIARITGEKRNTVEQRFHRAKKKLGELLVKYP